MSSTNDKYVSSNIYTHTTHTRTTAATKVGCKTHTIAHYFSMLLSSVVSASTFFPVHLSLFVCLFIPQPKCARIASIFQSFTIIWNTPRHLTPWLLIKLFTSMITISPLWIILKIFSPLIMFQFLKYVLWSLLFRNSIVKFM